jgi:hypothetical protein
MDISDYELNYKESEGIMMTADEIKSIEKQIQENYLLCHVLSACVSPNDFSV